MHVRTATLVKSVAEHCSRPLRPVCNCMTAWASPKRILLPAIAVLRQKSSLFCGARWLR